MSKAQFSIVYEGSAIEDGRISVGELAPSLLALRDLFVSVNKVLNDGKTPPVDLHVMASNGGSFEVSLELTQTIVETIMSLARQDVVARNLVEIVFGTAAIGTVGIVGLLRWLRGKRPQDVSRLEQDDGNLLLTRDDGDQLSVPPHVFAGASDEDARRHVGRAYIGLVDADGIDAIATKVDGDVVEVVTKNEAGWVTDMQVEGMLLADNTLEMSFVVRSPSFVRGTKYRLDDGNSVIYAAIDDGDFLNKVEAREVSFRHGDVLRCMTRVQQYMTDDGRLRTEHTILKVLSQDIQPTLDDLDGTPDTRRP